MFVEPPEGLEDCFGFVYSHETYYLTEADNKWEEWHGSSSSLRYNGAIVVSKKIKLKVERVIGQILNLKKVELPLDEKFGRIIEIAVSGIHHGQIKLGESVNNEDLPRITVELENLREKKSCPDFCMCKFSDKERIWGHHIYHLILKICADEIGMTYDALTFDYSQHYKIRIHKISEYLRDNDWDIRKGIAKEEGAVGFILLCILQNFREFFRLGNVHRLNEKILIDRHPFNDCNHGKCKYNNNYFPIWQSKSIIRTIEEKVNWPDSPYGLKMENDEGWFGDSSKIRQIVEERPLATIHQVDCRCSAGKYYFELYINKFVKGKVEKRCVRDSKNETQLSDNEAIDMLLSEYYGRFLPKKQAELVTKTIKRQYYQSKDNENVTKELDDKNNPETLEQKERHSKFLLRKTIGKMENVVSHWPDIKHLSEQISKPKGSKKKGGDNDG